MTPSLPADPFQGPRFRAPRNHGSILAVPDLPLVPAAAHANASVLHSAGCRVAGRPLGEFRDWARSVVLDEARRWTAERLGVSVPDFNQSPLFVTGHQPEFIHPGVWMKHLAVRRLADRTGGIGLNLVVDNDTLDRCSIRVPGGTADEPRFEAVSFDDETPQIPWEELQVRNPELFSTLGSRVTTALRPWGIAPVLDRIWPTACEAASRAEGVSLASTAARAVLERSLGLGNLELPISRVCGTEPFFLFVFELCIRHEEMFAAYNGAVASYRRSHKIRNDRHPVPDLIRDGDRIELPFWYWRPGETVRRRVFVQRNGLERILSADGETLCRFDTADGAVAVLRALQHQGRLRTRALTTTLFARLCFADLFVHGIGGAKYDLITDRIIATLWGIPVPTTLTLTATWHLPVAAGTFEVPDVAGATRRLRELRFHPERHLQGDEIRRLAERKRALVAELANARADGASKRERRERRGEARRIHRELSLVRERLAESAAAEIRRARDRIDDQRRLERAAAVLRSREYSVVIFPETSIREMVDVLDRELR